MKHLKLYLLLTVLSVLFISAPSFASEQTVQAAAISCPSEVRIGNVLSCKLTGLTIGNSYKVDAIHSDGNVSAVLTASSGTEYVRLTMTTADSDGLVPVALHLVFTNLTYSTTLDTALVNLINPGSDIPSSFFQNLLSAVLIIGIFGLLMTAFIIYKRR